MMGWGESCYYPKVIIFYSQPTIKSHYSYITAYTGAPLVTLARLVIFRSYADKCDTLKIFQIRGQALLAGQRNSA